MAANPAVPNEYDVIHEARRLDRLSGSVLATVRGSRLVGSGSVGAAMEAIERGK